MRIEGLGSEQVGNRARISATVTWEDCDRPKHQVYIETETDFADGLTCNPHAFLVACAIPAMFFGEERVLVDAPICPELREGLITALHWLRYWYYDPGRQPVRIDAKIRSSLPDPPTPARASFFFSGGIDSLATLRANRLRYPLEHPASIRDGLLVYGLELDDPQVFEYVRRSLSAAAQELDITFIPVYTNLYLHYRPEDAANHFDFWIYQFGGAALAAVAHAFARRITIASIAATFDLPNLGHWGSHPLLDPNYSSSDLRIRHEGLALSRLEKTRLVADWPPALQHLRVCNHFYKYQQNRLNCGECEKCVRTMLSLLALGALDRTPVFPHRDVSAELAQKAVNVHDAYVASCYQELITPLTEIGRQDLARILQHKIDVYYDREPGLKAMLKRWDRRYLDGRLKRALFSPGK